MTRTDTKQELIRKIAEEYHASEAMVTDLYEHTMEDLSAQARIRDYLPLMVARRVRQKIKDSQNASRQDNDSQHAAQPETMREGVVH